MFTHNFRAESAAMKEAVRWVTAKQCHQRRNHASASNVDLTLLFATVTANRAWPDNKK